MTEDAIQRSIVEYLDSVLSDDYRAFAIPNGARRTPGGYASNAIPGLRKGVADLAIVGRGRVYFVEVKTDRGKLSFDQQDWHGWCARTGTPYCVARSIDDMRIALAHWKLTTREHVEGVA